MKRLKVICVGAGYFARFHIEAWVRIPEVELIGICDFDKEKAKELAHNFKIKKTFQTLEDALQQEEFDIVDIITPPASHLELCRTATNHGKHIICQKPLAPTFEEAQLLIKTMNESNVKFMVHENFRFQPWHRKIKELIDNYAIGDQLFSLTHRMRMGDGWPTDAYVSRQPYFRTMPRLLIFETGIHFIDVFSFLLGNITSVYAKLRKLNPAIAGEDAGLIFFETESGCQAILDANRYNESNAADPRFTFGEMYIDGNAGSIRLDVDGNIFLKPLGESENQIDYQKEQKNFAGDCVYFTQKHFIKSLINKTDFETNGEVYLRNLEVQEAIYKSHTERKELLIDDQKETNQILSSRGKSQINAI